MRSVGLYDALGNALHTPGHKRYGFPRCAMCDKEVDSVQTYGVDDPETLKGGMRYVEAVVKCHGAEDSYRFTFGHNAKEDTLHLMITDHVWFDMSHHDANHTK